MLINYYFWYGYKFLENKKIWSRLTDEHICFTIIKHIRRNQLKKIITHINLEKGLDKSRENFFRNVFFKK